MFAAVCVVLAALGHVMMSGTAVPCWVVIAGIAVTGGTAWWLADRERGPLFVVGVTVAVQAGLHVSFSLAQAAVHPSSPAGRSLARHWLDHVLHPSPSGAGAVRDAMAMSRSSMDHGTGAMHSMHSMGSMHTMHSMHTMGSMPMHSMDPMHSMSSMGSMSALNHDMGALSSTGMLVAHLLAALLSGLWLAHGERAAFRILRALAGWFAAKLELSLRLPALPHRPRLHSRRTDSGRAPRRLLLTYAITSRGPPAGPAVA